jgi:hypothetical protein
MNFQKLVLTIAVIVLVVSLLVTGLLIRKSKSTYTYPPSVSECPDYFRLVSPNVCKNVHKLGKCSENGKPKETWDFNGSNFLGESGKQNKCKLANFCEISWDGIDNLC